ncbi:MAG: NADH-quinone oxidoreductase subunit NuoN [Chloroflexi bacterium]|nr:NADH-quinone oxidoreductase subunit NuoN [Chloroflexota bacterium]
MTFDVNQLDYALLAPEFIILGLIFVVWTLDLILGRAHQKLVGWTAVVGLVVGIAVAALQWGTRASFAGALRIDEFSVFFKIVFMLMAIGITLISLEYAGRFLPQPGEYYGLVLTGTLGMILMAESNELLTAYISLELLSFSSYVLVSYAKTNPKSNEAGMKYIILGAFSSALLLYGISLLYGALGTSYLPDIARAVSRLGEVTPALGVALMLILAGLGFKIAAVPFHMWTPDIYEGAPTPITAYLSVGSKAAGFALVLRLLVGGLLPIHGLYQTVFAVLAVLTMTLGNLVAIRQRNVKRLLAYSSIGQAGYVLVGVAALSTLADVAEQATQGMVLHLTGYVFTNLAAFGVIVAFQNVSGGRELISDMAGFARRAPFAGLVMMAALFSLAGMPLFAGFVTKFYLFAAAARADLLWLVAIAIINSTVSLYYYLLVIHQMYVRTPPGFEVAVNGHPAHGAHEAPHAPVPAMATAVAVEPIGAAAPVGNAELIAAGGRASRGAAGAHPGTAAAGIRVVPSADGHAPGHGAHAVQGAHDAHGAGGNGAGTPWWRRDITADMPPEDAFPPHRISWVTNLSLALFLVGIFVIGLWPQPVIDLLVEASNALFAG